MKLSREEATKLGFYGLVEEMPEDFAEKLAKAKADMPPAWEDGSLAIVIRWEDHDTGETLSVRTFNRQEFENLLSEWG